MIRVDLPWTTVPLRANTSLRSVNPHARAAAVRQVKAEAQWAIKAARLGVVAGANVTLHYQPKDRRRRDSDGLFPTLKVCLDALVAERVLADDSSPFVPAATCHIHPPGKAAMWLTLDELEGLSA